MLCGIYQDYWRLLPHGYFVHGYSYAKRFRNDCRKEHPLFIFDVDICLQWIVRISFVRRIQRSSDGRTDTSEAWFSKRYRSNRILLRGKLRSYFIEIRSSRSERVVLRLDWSYHVSRRMEFLFNDIFFEELEGIRVCRAISANAGK